MRDIGQLIGIGFDGESAPPAVLETIRKGHAGSIVLFRRNIGTPSQVRELTDTLQHSAARAGLPPLLIAVDQEGGSVRRLSGEDYIPLPSAMAMAASGDLAAVDRLVYLAGREMAVLGINQNYAPDLDVNVNPRNPVIGVRSFGEDPGEVARFGQHYVRALAKAGILATAKHFPGHGDTSQDSHHTLPRVEHSRDRLEAVELVPFRAAIAAGLPALMTAHIVFPGLEPKGLPATLSPRILGDLVRGELGFHGLVVTDSMEMQAIDEGYGAVRGAQMAIAAGADQVLLPHQPAEQAAAYMALKVASSAGAIPPARIRAALARMRQIKGALELNVPRVLTDEDRQEARVLAREIWRKAVAVVGAMERLPIRTELAVVTFGRLGGANPAEDAESPPLHPLVQALGRQVGKRFALPPDPDPGDIAVLHRETRGLPLVVALNRADRHPTQAQALARPWTDGPVVAVAIASPYDLRRLPVGAAGLTAFDPSPEAMAALADALSGRAPISGRWPVTLETRVR